MIVATPKSDEQLQQEAAKIAELICTTRTEKRGDLMILVAKELAKHGLHSTASIFQQIGKMFNS